MKQKDNKKHYELMSKNPDNWKGMFYVNSSDPRTIVPKQNPSFGWTLNFGNKYTFIGIIAIVLIIAGVKFFL